MKRVNNKKNLYKSIILLVIVVIGIGYAYLTSNLSITGSTEVVANTWDIHFENLNVTTGSVTASTPATIDSNETSITYAITLSRPKEYYEFTVDVVNEGTLPGKISISELSGLDTTSSKVIDYEVKYTNGLNVTTRDILNGGATKTIKVRVYYKDDITEDDFPENNLNLNLTYTLQFLQSDKDEVTTDSIIQSLKTNNSSCFIKYTGDVTDRVGVTEEATNVYFDNCEDKKNIIFGGFCWQVIRTTETGGIKMLYNGEPVDGKCESTRENHKGIVQYDYDTYIPLNYNYLYGNSFVYDISTNTFTITDTVSNPNYENLPGTFTCNSINNTCTDLYQINSIFSTDSSFLSKYRIEDTNYYHVGTSSFNVMSNSVSMVGYMFNKIFVVNRFYMNDDIYKFGSTFTYEEETNIYELSGTTQIIDDWSSGYNTINNTHYTCKNLSGRCDEIKYVYKTTSDGGYAMSLYGGRSIETALNEMLKDNDVNKYNSSIKSIVDNWYAQNLNSYTNQLEDAIYCNNRVVRISDSMNPNGGNTSYNSSALGYQDNLTCQTITNQFSINNDKAKLNYPVGLLNKKEMQYISSSFRVWTMTPSTLTYDWVTMYFGNDYSNHDGGYIDRSVRPAVSLKAGTVISSGTGSETDPWVVE